MGASLGSVAIEVTDLARSVEFYERAVGLTVLNRVDMEGLNEVILGSPDGGGKLMLAKHADRSGPTEHGDALWKLYFDTDDIDGLYRRAIEAGGTSVKEPTFLERWRVTIAFVQDPDGYTLELAQRDGG